MKTQGVKLYYKFPEATTPQLYCWYRSIDTAKDAARHLKNVLGATTEVIMEIEEDGKTRRETFEEKEAVQEV